MWTSKLQQTLRFTFFSKDNIKKHVQYVRKTFRYTYEAVKFCIFRLYFM